MINDTCILCSRHKEEVHLCNQYYCAFRDKVYKEEEQQPENNSHKKINNGKAIHPESNAVQR